MDIEYRDIARACLECDHIYQGDIYCHECDHPAGEPIEQEST